MSLVNAVRHADSNAGYPDYYVGQSRQVKSLRATSSLSSYLKACEYLLERKGIADVTTHRRPSDHLPARRRQRREYRDLDNPAVPAFTLDASQILRNVQGWSHTGSFPYQE